MGSEVDPNVLVGVVRTLRVSYRTGTPPEGPLCPVRPPGTPKCL